MNNKIINLQIINPMPLLNNNDIKEVADMIIPYIEKYEPAQWKELSKDTKWHLSL